MSIPNRQLQTVAASAAVAAMSVLACKPPIVADYNVAQPVMLASMGRAPCAGTAPPPDTSDHFISSDHVTVLRRNGYCRYLIPEYHDEQRLSDGGTDYGPVAKVYAFPEAGAFNAHTNFDTKFVNVGILTITGTAPLPGPYNALHLNIGANCLWLQHLHFGNGQVRWWGAVSPPNNVGECGNTNGQLITAVEEQPSTDPSWYPPVTRFEEGHGRVPYVGVKCGNAWCIIGPGTNSALRPPSFTGGGSIPTSPQWAVKGWFDDQTVGEPGTPSNFGIKPTVPLSVVPKSDLASKDYASFAAGWVDVATVLVPQGVSLPDKYKDVDPGYGFVLGENTISIRIRMENGQPVWRARVRNSRFPAGSEHEYPHLVKWTDHSGATNFVPATARWRWNDEDEELWVRCDIGCCRVTSLL